ncbi:MAG: 5-(carboxyamino)imidazole ribonucleotide mutase [Candidatus Aureabacteria bacterium]|nr:5-(carboxyamino)imidazole ribonucleotide mutase [Candidatus Auribacterota bacterium]
MDNPVVSIIMGSKSDYDIMKKAGDILEKFKVPYEIDIMSAHRTPEKVASFSTQAKGRGIQVIICGAGMSAHLAGVVAAHTDLPVIGVPLCSSGALGGVDALLSTSQMPQGVPVAAVAVNGSANAALLAVKILALRDESLQKKIQDFKRDMQKDVENASRKIKSGEKP